MKEQPYVGRCIISQSSSKSTNLSEVEVVASYFNPSYPQQTAVWVKGNVRYLLNWHTKLQDLTCVNCSYIIGASTGLMKELI